MMTPPRCIDQERVTKRFLPWRLRVADGPAGAEAVIGTVGPFFLTCLLINS